QRKLLRSTPSFQSALHHDRFVPRRKFRSPNQLCRPMIANEARRHTALMLVHSPFKIVRVADAKITSAAVQHVGPEAQRQSFDRLRTNGCPVDIRETEPRTNGCPVDIRETEPRTNGYRSCQASSINHHRPDARPRVHQVEALVDLLELQHMGDHRVDRDRPIHVHVDDLRHVGPAFAPPNAVPRQLRPVTSWNGRVEISFPASATPMMMLVPQPRWQHSSAVRITSV